MSDIADDDSRYSTPEEGNHSTRSTSYSEFCDDDVIRAATTDLTQPDGATTLDQFVVEPSSSAPPPSSSSTVVGKRKAPDDSVLSDRPYASYKRRAISTGNPVDIDSLAPLEWGSPSSSGATQTLCSTTPPLLDDTPDDSFKDRHHHHDAVGPEPYIIVRVVQRFPASVRLTVIIDSDRLTTRASNKPWTRGSFPGVYNGKLLDSSP